MKNILTLLGVGLKSNFNIASFSYKLHSDRKYLLFSVLILPFVVAGILSYLYGYYSFIELFVQILRPIGQERAVFSLLFVGAQIMVLIFGIFFTISVFYFSNDIELLVPLPVKPAHVILSKFLLMLVNEYLTIGALFMPGIIIAGIMIKLTLAQWLTLPIIFLLLPVIPLGIASVLVIILMRFVNISRKKDVMIILGSILLIACSIWFQVQMPKWANQHRGQGSAIMADILTSKESIVHKITSYFPPSLWCYNGFMKAFTLKGLMNTGALLAGSLLSFLGLIVLGQRIFYDGVISLKEIGRRKSSISKSALSKQFSSRSHPVWAVFIREWKVMMRIPVFLLNGILPALMMPVILFVTMNSGDKKMWVLVQKLLNSGNASVIILGSGVIMLISACMSSTPASAFSREGAQFWMSKVLPISWKDQIIGKFLHSGLIGITGNVIMGIVIYIVLKVNPLYLAAGFILATVGYAFLSILSMFVDLAKPMLNWDNPRRAIKQNVNVMIALLINFLAIFLSFVFANYLINKELSVAVIYFIFFAIFLVGSFFAWRLLNRFACRRYPEIEV